MTGAVMDAGQGDAGQGDAGDAARQDARTAIVLGDSGRGRSEAVVAVESSTQARGARWLALQWSG